jgi:Putative beta-lactamase-inhibitor-like, PepSY-like
MRHLTRSIVAGSFASFLFVTAGCNHHKEEAQKVELSQVPAPVMSALNTRFPGNTVDSIEKETENGAVVYDIELKQQGRKYEMDVKEDGTVMEIEKEIKDPPAAVTKAIQAKYPGAKIKEVMEKNTVKGKQETPSEYEVTLTTADGKSKEADVSLDGSSVKEEGEEKK